MDNQLYYGSDHKIFGPPEPPDNDCFLDITNIRDEKSMFCAFKVDGECHFDPNDWSEYCNMKTDCPDLRW